MWPAPIFAVMDLGHAVFSNYLAHPGDLSTTPGRAACVLGLTFLLGMFYMTMIMNKSQPRTLVSPAGLRTGLIRFYEWDRIHHVSKHGALYAIYHRVNPALPATSFKLRNPESQITFERYIAGHQIPICNDTAVSFTLVKISVLIGFILILSGSFWLRINTPLSGMVIILISFGAGVLLTLLLERFRGISKFGRYTPVIAPPSKARHDGNDLPFPP